MKRAAAVLGLALIAAWVAGEEEAPRKFCWPPHFGGLTAGFSNDSQMQRLFGHGVFRKEEGDSGGRLFINSARTATLHAEFYVDKIIGDLTLSMGIDPSLSMAEQRQAVSQYFNANEGFGNWHALHLGSTKKAVLENLGPPESGSGTESWSYSSSCTCELGAGLTITFVDDRINRVVFEVDVD